MGRNLTPAVITALGESLVRPAYLFQGNFDAVDLFLWSGVGELLWDGKRFVGNGWLRGFPTIQESEAIVANGFAVELSGLPLSLISNILSNQTRNLPGYFWLALLDSSLQLIADPIQLLAGEMSTADIKETDQSSTISIKYESKLNKLKNAPQHRYTHEGQRAFYPDDRGFEYVSYLQEWRGYWGINSGV